MSDNRNFRDEKRPVRPDGRDGASRPAFGVRPRKPAPHRAASQRTTSRDAALRALQDVVRSGAYAAQALSRQLDGSELSPEDKRLAASIFYCAAENRLRLQYALSRFMQTSADPVTEDILHVAAAQLLFMDRIPDHAAVDEAVKQARSCGREGLTGLVNGVLRALIRARDEGDSLLPDREEDPVRYISVRCSVAEHIVLRLIDAYGEELAERILSWPSGSDSRAVVRPNTMKISPAEFENWLTQRSFHWTASDVKNAYIVTGAGDLSYLDGFRRGYFSIQGESSMLAAYACQPKPGMQILDACAAPGGKSALLCELLNGTGRVHAWDVHEHRVELIRAAGRRLQLDNLRPALHDARKPCEAFEGLMDAVLVDAPCSGLGVISEKPDIKYRLTPEALDSLPPLQAEILNNCAAFVRPGGLLVYSTCTILPAENADRIAAFLEKHPGFQPDPDASWLPERLRGGYSDGMIQLLPCRDGVEGFFIARLRRKRT